MSRVEGVPERRGAHRPARDGARGAAGGRGLVVFEPAARTGATGMNAAPSKAPARQRRHRRRRHLRLRRGARLHRHGAAGRRRTRRGGRCGPDDERHRRPVHRQRVAPRCGPCRWSSTSASARSYIDGTMIGGSSFIAHLLPAMQALQSGQCNAVLVCYGSAQRTRHLRPARSGGQPPLPRPAALRDAVRADAAAVGLCAGGVAPHAPVRHHAAPAGRGGGGRARLGAAQSRGLHARAADASTTCWARAW